MARTVFKRAKDDRLTSLKPGEWALLSDVVTGKTSADITCPKCGKIGSLMDHEIDASGRVDPSLVCPKESCVFHRFGILDGWENRYAKNVR